MACSGNQLNLVVGGYDPRPGFESDFVMYMWKEGGYGARPGKKDNHSALSLYASGTRNEPVEVQERVYPILTHRYEFITDSAGAGRHRGGIGVARDFALNRIDQALTVIGNRNQATDLRLMLLASRVGALGLLDRHDGAISAARQALIVAERAGTSRLAVLHCTLAGADGRWMMNLNRGVAVLPALRVT